ncbi:MAG: hypothetical protein ACI9U2_003902, partial [Bradymonadia bacterium]
MKRQHATAAIVWALALALSFAGCTSDGPTPASGDVGTPGDAAVDAFDAAADMSLVVDRGAVDRGAVDQGAVDRGAVDRGAVDQGAVDEGAVDQGTVDQDVAPDADVDMAACADGAERPCDDCPDTAQLCADGQWQPCAGPAETCNGVDDDCDGQIDEDHAAVQTTCGVGQCARVGETVCVAGQIADDCAPGAPVAEACDGLDNDCDGALDNGLLDEDWFLDPDGDGAYGPAVAAIQPSCTAWRDAGAIESGLFLIDPDGDAGDPALSVYCDMASDGGGWTRVFHHDIAGGYWGGPDESVERAVDDPRALRYSILSRLEALRSTDGNLDLRITWPDSGIP